MATPDKIVIDLREALTDEAVAEALPHIGECKYSAPCIIGAMLPSDKRNWFDAQGKGTVCYFVEIGRIRFASSEQHAMAVRLQDSFDLGTPDSFRRVLADVRTKLAEQVQA